MHVFIYTKSKNNCETFLYKKIQTLCKKQDNFRYVLYTKSKTLYVKQFFVKFLSWNLYTKSMTLCVTWSFYIQKARHFSRSWTIPVTFIYIKSYTLDVTGFSWKCWSWNLYTKSMTLCVTWSFYIQTVRHFAKSKTICDTFLYTKIRHFCVTQFLLIFEICGGAEIFIH